MKPKVESQTVLKRHQMIHLLTKMWEIRIFEEKLQESYEQGDIYGTLHLSIGQEACAVGACSMLNKKDLIMSTHRNHGHSLAKGTDMRGMFAEILGKETGLNKGKGGSMHIFDTSCGNYGGNGIVGGNFPIAAGLALASQLDKTGQVVVCFAGDGAVNEGSFHEALNLAAIWHLPVIYFIENNQYAMSSRYEEMTSTIHLSERAMAYNIPGITIDGNDIELVQTTVKDAVDYARKGYGPTMIEAITYRQVGHSKSDGLLYRSEEEAAEWKEKNDPITRFEQKMKEQLYFTKEELSEIEREVRERIEKIANEVAGDAQTTVDELTKDVYYKTEDAHA